MLAPYTHDAPKAVTSLPEALAHINAKVLDEGILRKLADPDIYYAFERCRANGQSMDKADADALAMSVREWARSIGCIGYSHCFPPCGARSMARKSRPSWRRTSRPAR